jgi:hypothetical protein
MSAMLSTVSCHLMEEAVSNLSLILAKTLHILLFHLVLTTTLYTQLQYRNYSYIKFLKGGTEICFNRLQLGTEKCHVHNVLI